MSSLISHFWDTSSHSVLGLYALLCLQQEHEAQIWGMLEQMKGWLWSLKLWAAWRWWGRGRQVFSLANMMPVNMFTSGAGVMPQWDKLIFGMSNSTSKYRELNGKWSNQDMNQSPYKKLVVRQGISQLSYHASPWSIPLKNVFIIFFLKKVYLKPLCSLL